MNESKATWELTLHSSKLDLPAGKETLKDQRAKSTSAIQMSSSQRKSNAVSPTKKENSSNKKYKRSDVAGRFLQNFINEKNHIKHQSIDSKTNETFGDKTKVQSDYYHSLTEQRNNADNIVQQYSTVENVSAFNEN